jgi:alcohol dehydrogenase class IV
MLAEATSTSVFHLAPKIHYGPRASELAGEVMRGLGVGHALVVTDRGVLDAGVCAPVLSALERHGITAAIVSDVATNPSERHVEATVTHYRSQGCDGIIAIGGGSSMDVAKCVAAVVSGGGQIRDYEDGAKSVSGSWPPLVLVPTTSGSGSEVVGGAIIIDSERVFKMHVVAVPAHAALCDPRLTLSLPAGVTAACGIDALAHAIGAYVSSERQPLADGMALYAISVISRWLLRAVTHGDELAAREQMMIGSLSAGISMKGGGAADHAFAHAVNAVFKVHHGVAVARFLAEAMEYNLPHMPERFAGIAAALGVADPGGGAAAFGRAGIEAVRELVWRCPIPTLTEMGVDERHVDLLVNKVMEDEFHLGLNPVAISAEDARRIILHAIAIADKERG